MIEVAKCCENIDSNDNDSNYNDSDVAMLAQKNGILKIKNHGSCEKYYIKIIIITNTISISSVRSIVT